MTGLPAFPVGAAFNTVNGIARKGLVELFEVDLISDKADAFCLQVHGGQCRIAVYTVVIGFAHTNDKAAAIEETVVRTIGVLLNFLSVNVIEFFLHGEQEGCQRGFVQCLQYLPEVFADEVCQFITKGF